jgi:hypothetical protein
MFPAIIHGVAALAFFENFLAFGCIAISQG